MAKRHSLQIDEQTKMLVSIVGDNKADYCFFIDFKLLLKDQEVSIKGNQKNFEEFIH
ncbi:Uncharacterised protein [Clostridioides difficile]|uniref:hypothetical protein n=1 Tax=Clostridioides difficile TaxID=1496 RepID=UPI00038D4D9E|nr:hypothetical protein QIO_0604 [Clostridioides difficile DA00129]SJQ22309.1 Uncharacterised protein [Clostridioides difficile]SJR26153.1 Uncharacterised protein [Clostridioides difficile]SJS85437.1 Uncharacterised protein [Clostridioides difficile]VHP70558.1 ATPase [Clostridioides difficile]